MHPESKLKECIITSKRLLTSIKKKFNMKIKPARKKFHGISNKDRPISRHTEGMEQRPIS